MDKSKLIFLDTETTGIGPKGRVCQVAYKFQDQEFDSLFRPPVPIEIEAMSISHITNKMVADKEPFQNSRMHNDLVKIFSGNNIMVAHNAQFDVEMLKREGLQVGDAIDTFKIAHYLDTDGSIPRYNLQYLRYYFDLDVQDAIAHNALGDIRVLEKIFHHFFDTMMKSLNDEKKVLEEMIEVSKRPILLKKFSFGKYTGMKVCDIAEKDAGYLVWLLNQKIQSRERGEENDENWIYTLDYYVT